MRKVNDELLTQDKDSLKDRAETIARNFQNFLVLAQLNKMLLVITSIKLAEKKY